MIDEILQRAYVAYAALGQTKPLTLPFRNAAAVQWIARELRHRINFQRWDRLVKKIGSIAATPEVLDCLLDQLRNGRQEREVRNQAASALGMMGASGAKPAVLDALLDCIRDNEAEWVAYAAASALSMMGTSANTPTVVGRLLDCIRGDQNRSYAPLMAAYALGGIGATSTPSVFNALLDYLPGWRDNDETIRSWPERWSLWKP
jgi:HEAT repeat protein